MTEPMTELDLERLETASHTVEGWQISPSDALRLCEIARGRARLLVCSDCAKARMQHNALVAERDALRDENAKLRERVKTAKATLHAIAGGHNIDSTVNAAITAGKAAFQEAFASWMQRQAAAALTTLAATKEESK